MASVSLNPQRVSRACDACARRKIRCDRQRPCRPCLQRNIGSLCSGDVNTAIRRSRDYSDPLATDKEDAGAAKEIARLKEKIAALQRQIISNQSSQKKSIKSTLANDHAGIVTLRDPAAPTLDSVQDAVENLNLGLSDTSDPSSTYARPVRYGDADLFGLLPCYSTSEQIIRFSLTYLAWIHCALRADTFVEEHEDFFAALNSSAASRYDEPAWLALYFAVLSSGLYYMNIDHPCFSTFTFHDPNTAFDVPHSDEDIIVVSRLWYHASLTELERADYMGKAEIISVQTMAILTLVNKSFGGDEREWFMMAAATNMARSLSMDRLGTSVLNTTHKSHTFQWHNPNQAALGRRIWFTVVVCDWLGSMNRVPLIAPDTFNTVLDPDDFSEDVVLSVEIDHTSSARGISCLWYHAIMARIASIVRTYIKAGRSSVKGNLASAMTEVEKIATEIPNHLRIEEDGKFCDDGYDEQYPWIPFQRYMLIHVLQFIRLTIARACFDQWLHRQPDYFGFHRKAIQAAEKIVWAKEMDVPHMYSKSWIVCASTVAAGVFLGLDLLCFGTGEDVIHGEERRKSIETCIHALEAIGPSNVISRKGPTILRKLLSLDATWDYKALPTRETLRSIVAYLSDGKQGERNTPLPRLPSGSQSQIESLRRYDDDHRLDPNPMDVDDAAKNAFDEIFADMVQSEVDYEMQTFENPFEAAEDTFESGM